MSFLSTLLVLNVSAARAVNSQPSAASVAPAVEMTSAEMADVYGGYVGIDSFCYKVWGMSVLGAVTPLVGAFCLGWGIGRWLT